MYGQAPTVGGGPPHDTFSTLPPSPSQVWSAPPQGLSGPPPGEPFAPPKKSKSGLIVLLSVVLLVVLVGGIVGVIAFSGKHSAANTGPNQASGTPTATSVPPTPTQPAAQAGFMRFRNSKLSIIYPSGWMVQPDSSGKGSVGFVGPSQFFQVAINQVNNIPGGNSDPAVVDSRFCQSVGMQQGPPPTPTTVTVGGQQWTQEDCGVNQSAHTVVESTLYQNNLYSIFYTSLGGTFDSDRTQFFMPMEQSFMFLS